MSTTPCAREARSIQLYSWSREVANRVVTEEAALVLQTGGARMLSIIRSGDALFFQLHRGRGEVERRVVAREEEMVLQAPPARMSRGKRSVTGIRSRARAERVHIQLHFDFFTNIHIHIVHGHLHLDNVNTRANDDNPRRRLLQPRPLQRLV